jgi:hypothetical protein
VFAVALLLVGCTSSKTAASDVSITGCVASASGGRPVANGTIDNHSSKTSAYAIEVKFYDSSGNNVSEGPSSVASVAAGGTAIYHAEGLSDAKGPLTCKLGTVTRTESP